MQLISAFQLLNGYKTDNSFQRSILSSSLVQPLQMLPYDEKTDEWRVWNMDFYEMQGISQIRAKSRGISKNYRLANGVIDKDDYIPQEMDENRDLIDVLSRNDEPAGITELKFYPIIPNIVDLLVGEFIKKNSRVFSYAVDAISKNEKLEKKKELVDQVLMQNATLELIENLIQQGADLSDPEVQKQLAPESIQSLPEVEQYMRKSYRSVVEQWSQHQMNADRMRFKMDELEILGYRDSLVADMEFWEVRLMENDYEPRLLDPRLVFYHKSPMERYISKGNFAGYIELNTVSDVIDTLGYKMTEEEIKSLQTIFPAVTSNYLLDMPNDGSYYDVSKSYQENVKTGSLQFKRMMAFDSAFGAPRSAHSLFDFLMEDTGNSLLNRDLLRVTTCYWKSQKRVGHLSKIDETGELIEAIVSEDYEVTEKPLYDTTFYTDKTKDNIIFGEHIDWIWINEVWGGVKIGPNTNTTSLGNNPAGFKPIYLGIGDKKRPDRLPFQFKSSASLYDAPLPIEGTRFSERGSIPRSLVDRAKAHQVGYNMVNNKISDILIDELGTVIVLDQNTLPRHSMGQDWGKNNLAKAYVAMKDYQILPLDTSLANTESGVNFQNLTVLDASQTNRLLGLIQLANYFKTEALAAIGITPERVGSVNSQQTASGTQVAVNNSYSQTEKYFTQHCDFLMPRVWELMLSAAQYYHSKSKKSVQLTYLNDKAEQIVFDLQPDIDLLPRDVNVFCTTSYSAQELKKKLEQLALDNNTSGASIYDLGKILSLDTPTEILEALQSSEQKMLQQNQAQMQHEAQMQQQQLEAEQMERDQQRSFDADQNERDRQERIAIETMKVQQGGQVDTSAQDAYVRQTESMAAQQQHSDNMDLKREQEINKTSLAKDQLSLKEQEMRSREKIAQTNLQIARENKTQGEIEKRKKAKEQAQKKKK